MARTLANLLVRVGADTRGLEKALGRGGGATRALGGFGKIATGVLLAAGAAAATLAKRSLDVAAANEQTLVSFKNLTGSITVAKKLYEDLIQFAARTPFEVSEINQAAKALLGFNIASEDILPTIRDLGAAAAAGGGDLQKMAINFGQVSAAGKSTARDLREFVNQGIPIYNLLAESLGVSVARVQELQTEGKITGKVLSDAFRKASSEGGRFATTLEDQSKTFNGLVSTIKSQFAIVMDELGRTLLPAARIAAAKLVSKLNDLLASFKTFETQKTLQKFTVGFLTVLDSLNVGFRNIGAWIKQWQALGLSISGLDRILAGNFSKGFELFRKARDLSNEGLKEVINFGKDANDILANYAKNLDAITKASGKTGVSIQNLWRDFAAQQLGLDVPDIPGIDPPDPEKISISYRESFAVAQAEVRKGIANIAKDIRQTKIPLLGIDTTKITSPIDTSAFDKAIPILDRARRPFDELTSATLRFQLQQAETGAALTEGMTRSLQEAHIQQVAYSQELARSTSISFQFGQSIATALSFIPEAIGNAIASAKSFGEAWRNVGSSLIGIFKRLIADLIKIAIRTAIISFLVNALSGSASGFLRGIGQLLKGQLFNFPEGHTGGYIKKGGLVNLAPGEIVLPPAGQGPSINLSGDFRLSGNDLILAVERNQDNASRRRGPIR